MKFSKRGLLVTDIEFRTHYTEAKLAGFFFLAPAQACLAGRPGRLTRRGRELASWKCKATCRDNKGKKKRKTNKQQRQTNNAGVIWYSNYRFASGVMSDHLIWRFEWNHSSVSSVHVNSLSFISVHCWVKVDRRERGYKREKVLNF